MSASNAAATVPARYAETRGRRPARQLAAEQSVHRMAERSTNVPPVGPVEWAAPLIKEGPCNAIFPTGVVLQALKTAKIPVTHIGGDHDNLFPVENWHALARQWPTLRTLTLPRAGHEPANQYPQECADHIASFVKHSCVSP